MYRGNETHFDSMNPQSMRAEHDSVRCHRGQNGVSDAIHQLRKRITTSVLDEANMSTLRAEADRVRASGVSIPSAGTLCVPSGTPDNRPPFQRWESVPDEPTSPVRDDRSWRSPWSRAVGDWPHWGFLSPLPGLLAARGLWTHR